MSYHAPTQVFRLDPAHPDMAVILQAGDCIRHGGFVPFPTETVYGLGANALDAEAVNRIFAAKQRPAADPIIVHLADLAQLEKVARDIPPLAYELAEHFWPGPLTLILTRHENIPPNVAAQLATVAVRMPSHPIARALIEAAGLPIAAPSANTFSRPSATTAAHVLEDLRGRVDIVLDGGPTTIGLESTVLDLTAQPPVILRPVGVTAEALRVVIPDVQIKTHYLDMDTDVVPSPGTLLKHYSPHAEVILFTGDDADKLRAAMSDTARQHLAVGQNVGLLLIESDREYFANLPSEIVSLGHDMAQIGTALFAGLRELDRRGVDVILAREVARDGLGLAVWDRLVRAAEGRVVRVE